MKKTILLTIICAAWHYTAQAQFYISARGGYAFSVSSSVAVGSPESGNGYINVDKGKRIKESANYYGTGGPGLTFALAPGYMFNKHIGAELGIHYFMSEVLPLTDRSEIDPQGALNVFKVQLRARSNQVRVAPSVVIRGGGEHFTPYMKFGVLLPVYGNVVLESEQYFETSNDITKVSQRDVLDGAPSVGYQAAVGASFPLRKYLELYVEAEIITLTIKAAKLTTVKVDKIYTDKASGETATYDINSKDVSTGEPLISVSELQVVYKDKIDDTDNTYANPKFDPKLPRNELARLANYNSLGVHVGLRYSF